MSLVGWWVCYFDNGASPPGIVPGNVQLECADNLRITSATQPTGMWITKDQVLRYQREEIFSCEGPPP